MYYDYRIVDTLFSTKFSCDDDNYWKTEIAYTQNEDKTFETPCAFVEIQCPYIFLMELQVESLVLLIE